MAQTLTADLHTHSRHSDGSLTPGELRALALERGVDLLAVTDHDTVAAYADEALCDGPALRVIGGIELSARWRKRDIHVVGLNIDPRHAGLREAIESQRVAREDRGERIARRLERRGVPDALAGARRYADGGTLGRPHFAAHLVACKKARDTAEAFRKYLGEGKPGDVRTAWPELETAIGWIVDAGGVATLAHPAKYRLTRTRLFELIADFKDAGGAAMEVISGLQQHAQTRTLASHCERFDLLASSGSDFHHRDQRWAQLGRGLTLPPGLTPVWSDWM
jgi:hypothetical protein